MPLLSPLVAYGEGAKPTAAELIPEQIPLDAETLLDSGRVREASTTKGTLSYKQTDRRYSLEFVDQEPTSTDNDQIFIPLFLGVNAYEVAYVAYRITNTSESTLLVGTRVYLNSGVERIAGATAPLLYSAVDGKPLESYSTSYDGSSNKLVMTKSVATAAIQPSQSVYVVVPMSAANVTDRYVPCLPKGETAFTGNEITDGNLIFQQADHTNKTNEMYGKNGYLYLKSISVLIRGVDPTGAAIDTVSCTVDDCFAVGVDSKPVEESWAWADFSLQEPTKLDIPSLSVINREVASSASYSGGTATVTTEATTEDHYKVLVNSTSPAMSSKLTVPFGMEYNVANMRYIAYRFKNTSSETVNIGTRLNFFNGITRQAGATAPLVYDAATGERLNAVSSWSYGTDKLVIDKSIASVEIPAGGDVFILIPMTTVGGNDRVVPGLPQGKLVSDGTKLTDGNLRMRSQAQAEELKARYDQYGWLHLSAVDIYYCGSGSSRAAVQQLSYEISELFGVTLDGTVLAYLDLSPEYSYKLNESFEPIAPTDKTVGVGAQGIKDGMTSFGSKAMTAYDGTLQINTKTLIEQQSGEYFDKLSFGLSAFGKDGINIYSTAYFGFYLENLSPAALPLRLSADISLPDGNDTIPLQVSSVLALTEDLKPDTSIKGESSVYGTVFNIPSGWSGWLIIPMLTLGEGSRGAVPALESGEEAFVRLTGSDYDEYTLSRISEAAYFAGKTLVELNVSSFNIIIGCDETLKQIKQVDIAVGGLHCISREEYGAYKSDGTVPSVLKTSNPVSSPQIKIPEKTELPADAEKPRDEVTAQENDGLETVHIILLAVGAVVLVGTVVAEPFIIKKFKKKKIMEEDQK